MHDAERESDSNNLENGRAQGMDAKGEKALESYLNHCHGVSRGHDLDDKHLLLREHQRALNIIMKKPLVDLTWFS